MKRPVTIGAILLLFTAVPALAVLVRNWVHPCPCGNRSGNSKWSGCPNTCRCKAAWDDSLNWSSENVPNASDEVAEIEHSNYGCCTGNCACSVTSNCTGACSGTCDTDPEIAEGEVRLVLELTTVTIQDFWVTTQNTSATTDGLIVFFENKTTDNVVTSGGAFFDSTNGPITLKITDGATIKTDTTD